jgi:N6-L-threonylcarbamoyladenine synthase
MFVRKTSKSALRGAPFFLEGFVIPLRRMRILAIETSCDETAVAIAEFSGSRKNPAVRILANVVSSQVPLHAKFGGVVPNLAKREHQKNLVPVLLEALGEAGGEAPKAKRKEPKVQGVRQKLDSILDREQELLRQFKRRILGLAPPPIDAIAVTYGPGLLPALWVGVNFAKALGYIWHTPLIPVNHMAGHFFSAFLQKSGKEVSRFSLPTPRFPALGLLVSGGHTELALVKKPWNFSVIGQTRDDAAGEAFDKVARILGLKYPGGPEISRLAEKGDPKKYHLSSPMINTKDYDFSFSGLKTAVLYLVRDLPKRELRTHKADIAASFEKAAVDVLVKKAIRAAKDYKAKTILLGGGVAANRLLRQRIGEAVSHNIPDAKFYTPDSGFTGDNALMIALAGYFMGKKTTWSRVKADANLQLHIF